MLRKRKPAETPLAETLATLREEIPALKVATKLPRQLEPATYVEKVRPTGPRKRSPDEMANIFASKEIRIDKDGRTYQMRAERDLTGDEKALAARNGLTPVDDEERVFNGTQTEINRAGGDINAVGYLIGKGRGRGR